MTTKKQGTDKVSPQQLSFELGKPKRADGLNNQIPKIVRFVDSATLGIRKQAIERVASAGIFSPIKKK